MVHSIGKLVLLNILLVSTVTSCTGLSSTGEDLSEAEEELEAYYLNATLQAMTTQVADEATFGVRLTDAETTIGDLNSGQAMLLIPAGAFDNHTEVALETLTDIPPMDLRGVEPLGKAISIGLLSTFQRSSKPIQVSLKFDNNGIQEPGEILVGYYHEDYGWELFEAEQVNLDEGILTFTTYHFSTFSAMRVDEPLRMQRYITQQAKQDLAAILAFEQGSQEISLMVEALMREGLDIQDDQLVETMISEVLAQFPDSDMSTALQELDQPALIDAVVQTTVKILVQKLMDKSIPIDSINADYGSDKAIKEAYRIAARAKRNSAERILTNHLMDNLPTTGRLYKAARRAVVLGEITRTLWLNSEVQNAFDVYAQGSENWHYGYSTERGNFDLIMSQNRGGLENILDTFVTALCRIHDLDESRLEKASLNGIRAESLKELQRQFDLYLTHSAELDGLTANIQTSLEMYASRGLLDQSAGKNPMIDDNQTASLETLIEQMLKTQEMIASQIDRQEVVDTEVWQAAEPTERVSMIPREVMIELVYQWFDKDLLLNPLAFSEITKALQTRLEKNSGWGADEISTLVEDMLKKYG